MIFSIICHLGPYNIQKSMNWCYTLQAWWKSDEFQQLNTAQAELDHIIKVSLLCVKVLKSSPSFKTLRIRSRQKTRLTPLWASSSFSQFCFDPNSLTVYILGSTSALPLHAYSNRTEKKEGKHLKRYCAYFWIWSTKLLIEKNTCNIKWFPGIVHYRNIWNA